MSTTPTPKASPTTAAPDYAGETAGSHGHDHSGGLFGDRTELYFSVASGIFWAIGLVTSFTELPEAYSIGLFVVAILLGGYFSLLEAYEGVTAGRFEIDFLMVVAAAGAAALGEWQEAALLLFLFSLGHALEHYAMQRARKSISALAELAPATALLKTPTGTEEVGVEVLKVGDTVVVKPNTKIPADGVVTAGSSAVDQSAITGESVPVDKTAFAIARGQAPPELSSLPAEHRSFAGTINGSGALEVMVLKPAKDSTLSKLVTLVQEAERQKSPTQQLPISSSATTYPRCWGWWASYCWPS